MKSEVQELREWLQWLAELQPRIEFVKELCSAPFCEKQPSYVCFTNYIYFLCKDCYELLLFEKRYAKSTERNTL